MANEPPKNPCPWRAGSDVSECRCDMCKMKFLRAILAEARLVRYKTKALKEAIKEYEKHE
jgi:hypothetical protein